MRAARGEAASLQPPKYGTDEANKDVLTYESAWRNRDDAREDHHHHGDEEDYYWRTLVRESAPSRECKNRGLLSRTLVSSKN